MHRVNPELLPHSLCILKEMICAAFKACWRELSPADFPECRVEELPLRKPCKVCGMQHLMLSCCVAKQFHITEFLLISLGDYNKSHVKHSKVRK